MKEAPRWELKSSTRVSGKGKSGKEIHIASSPIRYKGLTCPRCFAPADGITMIARRAEPPVLKPGCVVVCSECCEINMVTPMVTLRKATAYERRDVMRDPDLRELVELAATMRNARGAR